MEQIDGTLCAKVILKGDAFNILQTFEEYLKCDVLLYQIADLNSHSVVYYGTINDVVVV